MYGEREQRWQNKYQIWYGTFDDLINDQHYVEAANENANKRQ